MLFTASMYRFLLLFPGTVNQVRKQHNNIAGCCLASKQNDTQDISPWYLMIDASAQNAVLDPQLHLSCHRDHAVMTAFTSFLHA